jgi:hypothetical protein
MLGVFTWLGQYIYQALKYFYQGLEKIFGPFLAQMIPVICPILFAAYWIVNQLAAWMSTAAGYLQSITIPSTNLTGLSFLAVANSFFPLDSGMAALGVYLLAIATLTTYRLVKSWIPTLS